MFNFQVIIGLIASDKCNSLTAKAKGLNFFPLFDVATSSMYNPGLTSVLASSFVFYSSFKVSIRW